MKKQAAKMPNQVEWDFHEIPENQQSSAALFEYARTSKLRDPITKLLGTIHEGKPISQLFFESQKAGDIDSYNMLRAQFEVLGLAATKFNYELTELLTILPYFPKPFVSYGHSPLKITYPLGKDRLKNLPPFSTVTIEPMPEVTARYYKAHKMEPGTKVDLKVFGSSYHNSFKLSIRWEGFGTKQIIKDFTKWLSAEAKNHPEKKPIGKTGHLQFYPLTWLAAFRIHRAGVSYMEAQAALKASGVSHYQMLPMYSEKGGWSRAIGKAEKLLSDLEAGKSIVGL